MPIAWEDHLTWFEGLSGDQSRIMFAVMEGVTIAGVCGLTGIDYINRRAEFSLYIDPSRHRTGLGSAALKSLVSFGFNTLGLNLIWGESFDGNPAIKMFERVGFEREGTRREFYFRDGKFIDAHLFSITWDQAHWCNRLYGDGREAQGE